MKILIITVAGTSSRFSKSIGHDVLKCIYYEKGFEESLLYCMLKNADSFDKYIIVGGYKYDELELVVHSRFTDISSKIDLIYNPHFKDYGSGYSLYLGIRKALEYDFNELVFAEGDLYVDFDSLKKVFNSKHNVITSNTEPIYANKAVAFYYDRKESIRYIYDTGHSALEIKEPFLAIFNSGQIWKFNDKNLLKKVTSDLTQDELMGTNLVIIEKYFGQLLGEDVENVRFNYWVNCNTVEDFRNIERD